MGRSAHPTPPPAVEMEVREYARENGRLGSLHWVPGVNAFEVRLSLKSDDPLQQLARTTGEEQYEKVLLMEPNPKYGQPGEPPYRSLDPWQLGPSGVRDFLERGNTWSGRGEFASHAEAVRKAKENRQNAKDRVRKQGRQNAVDLGLETRRQIHKIPFHRVGIDLKGK